MPEGQTFALLGSSIGSPYSCRGAARTHALLELLGEFVNQLRHSATTSGRQFVPGEQRREAGINGAALLSQNWDKLRRQNQARPKGHELLPGGPSPYRSSQDA